MDKQIITTSFKQLHDAGACTERYRHLAKALGGITKYGRTTPINLLAILEHNGLDDLWWCLESGAAKDNQVFRLIACDIAESVLPIFEKEHPDDKRPRESIEVARKFASGEETEAARSAAWSAASSAARSAAWSAAWSAASSAASSAARSAASSAQRDMQIEIIKKYLS